MAQLFFLSGRAWCDANGAPYPAATADFFVPGTTTGQDTYTSASLGTPNSNPVVSDASTGIFPDVYFAAKRYKVRIRDASANTLKTWEVVDATQTLIVSASAPSPTYPLMRYANSTDGKTYMRNLADDAWVDLGGTDTPIGAAATITETIAGTSTTKGVSPDSLQGLLGKGSDLTPAAGTISLPSTGGKHYSLVAGAVSGMSSGQGGREVWLHCAGASEMTNNDTSWEIDGGADYDTEAGDILICVNKAATDASGTNWRVHVVRKNGPVAAFPRGALWGLTTSRASATTFGIAVGECTNENASSVPRVNMRLTSAFTKSLSTWAVGTGNGGLDTGSVTTATWYHIHLIRKISDGSIDVLYSTSVASPTMPSGYEARRRIGSFLTDGSSQIVSYSQVGDEFLWDAAVIDVDDDNPGTSAVSRTLSTPLGVKTLAVVSVGVCSGTGIRGGVVSSLDVSDQAPQGAATAAMTGFNSVMGAPTGGSGWGFVNQNVRTNTSSQVRSRIDTSGANDRIAIITRGWIDHRGRQA